MPPKKSKKGEYSQTHRDKQKKEALENMSKFILKKYEKTHQLERALRVAKGMPGAQQIIINNNQQLHDKLRAENKEKSDNHYLRNKERILKKRKDARKNAARIAKSVPRSGSSSVTVPPSPSNSQLRRNPLVTTGIFGDDNYKNKVLPLILPRR